MEKKAADFNLNGTNLVLMVWQRKFVFLFIALAALIVSLTVSFLITPQFKSTAVLIPSVASQASKDVLTPLRPKGLTVFGDDEEVEHLLQLLSSVTLRTEIVNTLNLFNHYGIDPNDKHAWSKVNNKFSNNVSFRPSRFRSVLIEVYDESPDMASKIANSVVVVADSLMRNTKRTVAQKALDVLEKQYQQALSEFYALDDSLSYIMSKGVLDLPFQTKEYTRSYTEALTKGNMEATKKLENAMANLAKYGASYTRHIFDLEYKSRQIRLMEESLQILRIEAEGVIPSQFVIDWAVPSDKKAKPRKLVIVIVSTLAALFFSFFAMVLIDFFRKSLIPPTKVEE